MGAKCKKLPGIIREEDKKLGGRAGSSVLQYGTPVAKSSCATKMSGPMYMYDKAPTNFKIGKAIMGAAKSGMLGGIGMLGAKIFGK